MPFPTRSSHRNRHLGLSSAIVLALSLAATSTAFAQSAYQPGWSGNRSDVIVDLSVLDGGSAPGRVTLHPARSAPAPVNEVAQSDEVTVDLSALDGLGPVQPANERRIVLHRPTTHYAAVSHHFHLHKLAHRGHGHAHLAHRAVHSGFKLASAKTKASDAQCCPVPDTH